MRRIGGTKRGWKSRELEEECNRDKQRKKEKRIGSGCKTKTNGDKRGKKKNMEKRKK